MEILSVYDPQFREYGRIVENIDFTELLGALKEISVGEGVTYEPSVEALEATSAMEQLSRIAYGEMPIQIGHCSGHNTLLNALEYHRDSEVNVMATDAILLVGLKKDVKEDFTYHTEQVKAFLVPEGVGVELYATTLHYAPCSVNGKEFKAAVVLPRGTNYPLQTSHARIADQDDTVMKENCLNEDALLTAVNKWLIGHLEGGLEPGCFLGLKGRNISVLD